MKNKYTKIDKLLECMILESENFKENVYFYKNRKKVFPNKSKKISITNKKTKVLEIINILEKDIADLSNLIVDYKIGKITDNEYNITNFITKKEKFIDHMIDELKFRDNKIEKVEKELLAQKDNKKSQEEILVQEEAKKSQAELLAQEEARKAQTELLAQEEARKAQAELLAQEETRKAQAELLAQEEIRKAQTELLAQEEARKAQAELLAQEEDRKAQAKLLAQEEARKAQAELLEQIESLKEEDVDKVKNEKSHLNKDIISLFTNSKSILSLKIDLSSNPLEKDIVSLEELEQEDDIVDEIDLDLIPIFLEGCSELIPEIDKGFSNLLSGEQENKEELYRNLHTLKGNVGMVGALRARREVHTLESVMQKIKDGRVEILEVYEELKDRFENIRLLMDAFNEGNYDYRLQSYEIKKLKDKISLNKHEELKEIEELEQKDYLFNDDIDESLIEFLLEDIEIYQVITQQIKEIQYGETDLLRSLTNNLHSIKGSLGTVGYKRAKKEVHEMEDFFKESLFKKQVVASKEISRLNELKNISFKLMDRMDNINLLIEEIQKGNYNYRIPSFNLIEKHHKYQSYNDKKKEIINNESLIKDNKILTEKDSGKINGITNKPFKIPVDIMGRLINEISEASLIRSSLLTSSFSNQNLLKEFEDNLERLKRMLRELEIQAESQIQSRQEETGGKFDPLELDRFTRLQELTRFLTEGINDIFDIHQLMSKISNNQETMLASQERSINEVQETLGRTRLVPFSTVSSIFERVVMLTQKEVGKNIDFRIDGELTEIDGTLIDKLKTPLEHVLRNAISHGIETPEERIKLGKNSSGKLTIYVTNNSGKINIKVEDDGAGIKIEKVRQKAIEKGLWNKDNKMTALQAADMICLPNFSTADKLSEISGRGVGMDAVRNSIFSLGGTFEIISVEGTGLTVNMQIPTTIATVSALICQVSDEKIAMPVDIVDNIFMIKSQELIDAYNKGQIQYENPFTMENKIIDFRFMIEIMGLSNGGVLTEKDIKVFNHIVVVKSESQYLAVLVDDILGVKEVPLRPASTFLASIPGVIGVTILNDGKACYVMDIIRAKNKLLRELNININKEELMPLNVINSSYNMSSNEKIERIGKPLVLVVDDSLTVRKATERFLQKSGFDYALAKDGQDALEMLSTVSPDLILLDVEMPRMDGFEFAKHVREHQQHQEVPIIMITSRIAEKHKKNAFSIGVNEYTGKPFKEEEMLSLIHKYI